MRHTVLTLVAALFTATAYSAPLPVFGIFPSGTVSGSPGTVIGWGYDITNNDPSNWMVLNDSFVTGGLSTGTFGTYQDYIASGFIVIDPSSTTGNVAFSQGSTGTGEFDIHNFVPPMTITGGISIDYSVFSQDPNSPSFDPGSLVSSGTVSAVADAQVGGVPEPASIMLTCFGLLLLVVAGWRRSVTRRS